MILPFVILLCLGCNNRIADVNNKPAALIYKKEIILNNSVEVVWKSITEPEIVNTYYLAPLAKFEMKVGGEIVYGSLDQPLISGPVLDITPNEKLQHSFQFDITSHRGVKENSFSRVTNQLKSQKNKTVLTLLHDQFGEDYQTYANVATGWPIILSGLKAQIENATTE